MEVEPGIHVEAVEWDQQLEELQSQESDSAKKKVDNLEEQHLVKDAKLEVATSNVVQAMKAVQQIAEENCPDKHIPINSSVEQAAGLKTRKGNADAVRSPNKFFLARHGESDHNVKGFLSEDNEEHPSQLTEKGIGEAKKLAKSLRSKKIDVVYVWGPILSCFK